MLNTLNTLTSYWQKLQNTQRLSCPLCATPLPDPPQPVCEICFEALPWSAPPAAPTDIISAFDYAPPISGLILAGKTGKQLDKLQLLAELTAQRLPQHIQQLPEAILPVPLHPQRLRQRGFNQSLELVRPLAKRLQLPILNHSVIRNRQTLEQKTLRAAARSANLQGAFRLNKPLPYRHIAIFDDVLTTGATCQALASLLLAHEIETVQIWVCANTKQ